MRTGRGLPAGIALVRAAMLLLEERYADWRRNRIVVRPARVPGRHRVLVQGLSRSGTSALLYKIVNSLASDDTQVMSELPRYPGSLADRVVAKVLLDGLLWSLDGASGHVVQPAPLDLASYAFLDKHVAIVRDPRDRLISQLLYLFFHEPYCRDDRFVESMVGILRRKEADPDSVRVLDLMAFVTEYPRYAGRLTTSLPRSDAAQADPVHVLDNRLVDYLRARPELFVVYYEDMVAGYLGALEDYLGLSLCGPAEVDPAVKRVARTRARGDHRNWFTGEDIVYYERLFAKNAGYFRRYSHRIRNRTKVIRPEHASGYVLRVANEGRAGLNLPAIVM